MEKNFGDLGVTELKWLKMLEDKNAKLKHIYKTRDMAHVDVFDYIEVFCNRSRRYSRMGGGHP